MTRIATALVLMPALWLLIKQAPPIAFFVIAIALIGAALWECYAMLASGGSQPFTWMGLAAGLVAAWSFAGYGPRIELQVPLVIATGLAVCLAMWRRSSPVEMLQTSLSTVFPVLFVGLGLAYLLALRAVPGEDGKDLLLLLFACVILADTAAYYVGSAMGRHRMAPMLSPKKSWEGALGGLLASAVGALLAHLWFYRALPVGHALVVGLILGLAAIAGDLAASMVKRAVGVKDASALLPGHGGVLDRTDSLLFSGPILYYYYRLFIQVGALKRLAILGSTGSIGTSTLDVVSSFPERFEVATLAAGRNVDLLEKQVRRHRPERVATGSAETAAELERRVGSLTEVTHGLDGLVEAAGHPGVDLVVSGLVGAVGLLPTYAAVEMGRDVALANKETLVVAGQLMTDKAAETGARILPVDSEHNALHQCLKGEDSAEVRRIWLTASGGPFRCYEREALTRVTAAEALNHPTWKMGPKITVDSATMMNKGLEVIEARWLFGIPAERIRVVVHPKSVVHSMVEFVDGSFKAQLGITDMRHPIQYALSWPERWQTELPPFDPVEAGPLEFEPPDFERFPCLGLAYRAIETEGAAPAVLNAANEVAVQSFLEGRAGFLDIPGTVEAVLERHGAEPASSLEQLLDADARARETARETLRRGVRS